MSNENKFVTNLLGQKVVLKEITLEERDLKDVEGEIVGVDDNFGFLIALDEGYIRYYTSWGNIRLKRKM